MTELVYPYNRYRAGTPAGGNLVKSDLDAVDATLLTLDSVNIADRGVPRAAFATEAVTEAEIADRAVTSAKLSKINDANLGAGIDWDSVDGRHASDIGLLGLASRTVTLEAQEAIPNFGMTDDFYQFYWHLIVETFTPSDLGMNAFPFNYGVEWNTDKHICWTHPYGLHMDDASLGKNKAFPSTNPTYDKAQRVGQWIVSQKSTTQFTLSCLAIKIFGFDIDDEEYFTGGCWLPASIPSAEFDLDDWLHETFTLRVAVTGAQL